MICCWHLFWPDGIHEFVKFLEEQNDDVLFIQELRWCTAVNRYTSLFSQLYWPSFVLFYLTIAILHTQRIVLLTTACNWKHRTSPFLRKASFVPSSEDRPHHHGWRKTFPFHFPQNLQDLVRQIQSLSRSKYSRSRKCTAITALTITPMSMPIKLNLLSESATSRNAIKETLCNSKTVIQLL